MKTEVDGVGGYLTLEPGTGGQPGQGLTLDQLAVVVVLALERTEAPRDCETPALNLITGSADQRQNRPQSDAALVKGKSAELPSRAATRRQWPLH